LTIKLIFRPNNEKRERFTLTSSTAATLPGYTPLESDCFITRLPGMTMPVAVEREDPRQGDLAFPETGQQGQAPAESTTTPPPLKMVGGGQQ
jgi:hypothetical protein